MRFDYVSKLLRLDCAARGEMKDTQQYNAIVVGLGAMGSATMYHLAQRGCRVLGLEQFAPGHTRGSSHGDSRIIRETYFEHPLYVPLVRRAHELWRDLERRSGASLMTITGGLMIGPPDGVVVSGTLRSAAEHDLPHSVLSPLEVRERFPAFQLADHLVAVFDPRRIVNSMEDAWDLLRREHKQLPRAVNFISGPSRTADIEQTVTLGAHGPYRVLLILAPIDA